jgi:hypothetical protein
LFFPKIYLFYFRLYWCFVDADVVLTNKLCVLIMQWCKFSSCFSLLNSMFLAWNCFLLWSCLPLLKFVFQAVEFLVVVFFLCSLVDDFVLVSFLSWVVIVWMWHFSEFLRRAVSAAHHCSEEIKHSVFKYCSVSRRFAVVT